MVKILYKNWLASYNYCTDSVASKAHGSQPCMAEMSAYTVHVTPYIATPGGKSPSVLAGGATGPSGPLSYSTDSIAIHNRSTACCGPNN